MPPGGSYTTPFRASFGGGSGSERTKGECPVKLQLLLLALLALLAPLAFFAETGPIWP
jgi:hypothetical protein